MTLPTIASLRALGDKIATELVFAEPGSDNGLLPVNSLLLELEESIQAAPASDEIFAGVQAARACVDTVFAGAGLFDAQVIAQLGEWTAWFQGALTACESGAVAERFVPPAPAPCAPAAAPAASHAAPADAPLVLNLEHDAELVREFIHESAEHLQNIEQGVLTLEASPSDPDTLNSIFRAFHTFKGGAGFLNLAPIHDLAHELESLLDLARQGRLLIGRPVVNLILEGGDCLKRFCDRISARLEGEDNSAPIHVPTSALLGRIRAAIQGGSASPEIGEPQCAAAPMPDAAGAVRAPSSASVVKVDTHKLDGLIDAVGEMVIAQSLVVQNPALRAVQNEQLTRNLAELARITKELQRTAMSLRMVPIRSTFQKMHRVIRDITAKVGKKVQLVTSGEDTELDRTIVEEIGDPLVHMVRNAVDHGIELPESRAAQGKPEQGTVSLKAYHQGGSIVVEIADDGKGLDRAAILAKARDKGLVGADEQLADSDIFNLIFAPGFSTAKNVTELSGRGVGMDVVRRNIDKLRGKIEISSKPGEGSTFRIYLPLTLAIIDGLLVGVGEHRYILPTLTVSESFRPAPNAIKTVQGRGEMIDVRGRLRPLVRLYQHLGVAPASTDPSESIVVVVQASSEARCVLVDRLLGKQEVVIKSLGETFNTSSLLAGAAILGDGRVGLILDSQTLVHLQSADHSSHSGLPQSVSTRAPQP